MILKVNGQRFELSMFDIQEALERCEIQVGFPPKETSPTIELLQSVATWASMRFSVQFTLTAAWQLWWAVCELIESARKAHTRVADVGAWLHIDATELTDFELFGLSANLPRIRAQHKLQAGQFDPLKYDAVYDLVLLATGSKEQAQKAKAEALERYVDSRCGGS